MTVKLSNQACGDIEQSAAHPHGPVDGAPPPDE
jgi:hypothetical protein